MKYEKVKVCNKWMWKWKLETMQKPRLNQNLHKRWGSHNGSRSTNRHQHVVFYFFIHSGFFLCFIHRAHWGCHIGLWSRNILEPICIQMYSDFAAKRQNSTYFRDLERQALAAILPSITFNFLNVAAQNTFVLESGTIWCFSTIFLPFNKTGSGLQTWNFSSTL